MNRSNTAQLWSSARTVSRERLRLAVSLIVLATVIYLVQLAIFYTPQFNFEIVPSTWQVLHAEACAGEPCLRIGDQVRRIGDLDFDRYIHDRSAALDAETDPIEVEFERAGQIYSVAHSNHAIPSIRKVTRICSVILAPVAFWFAGAAALLFMRPLGKRGSLYVALFYSLSVFFAAGWSSWSQAGYSWYFLHVVLWLLVPLLVHFHASVAGIRWLGGKKVFALVLLAAVGFLAEVLLPDLGNLGAPALLVAILISGSLLALGWLRPGSPRRQRTCRIMGVGLFIGITPFVLTLVVPAIEPGMAGKHSTGADFLLVAVAILSIPVWPASYLYAVHEADDRDLRFRANQWLGQYGFYSLALTSFLVLQMLALRALRHADATGAGLNFTYVLPLVACGLLLLAAPAIKNRFQRWVDARVFGIRYEPETVLREFARRIPTTVDSAKLRSLLCDELLPTLMIHQSSLFVFSGDQVTPIYLAANESLPSAQALRWIAEEPDTVKATGLLRDGGAPWVRLVLPVSADDRLLGIWLFGDRDPDDYYSADDVELLESLAGMVGAVIWGQQATAVRSTLLANISHELRTPLNGILGPADLLLRSDELSPSLKAHCTAILASGDAILQHVDNLLDLAGAEVGRTELKPQPFQPRTLLQRVVHRASPSAQAKGIGLRLEESATLRDTFLGDDERIGRVLDLLLSNAIKFTDHGEITLGASRDAAKDSALRLWVSDTGIGIPPTELDRIFDSFTQVDTTATRRHDGMGLGLAICNQLAQRLGGSLGVESKPGKGSLFWLDVPLPSPASEEAEAVPQSLPTDSSPGDGPRYRVLVAEDDPVSALVVREMLEHLECSVEVVANGGQALSRMSERSFELVLMDCQMPVMTGFEATSKVRQREHELGLPPQQIVALTAHGQPEDLDHCYQTGMNEVLLKPIRLDTMRELIKRRIAP